MHLRASSRGRTANGSMRHSDLSCSERKDNWEGQQIDRRPRNVRRRAAPDEAEKRDQIVFAVCCSVAESVSRRCRTRHDTTSQRKKSKSNLSNVNCNSISYHIMTCSSNENKSIRIIPPTFCKSSLAPASTMR